MLWKRKKLKEKQESQAREPSNVGLIETGLSVRPYEDQSNLLFDERFEIHSGATVLPQLRFLGYDRQTMPRPRRLLTLNEEVCLSLSARHRNVSYDKMLQAVTFDPGSCQGFSVGLFQRNTFAHLLGG